VPRQAMAGPSYSGSCARPLGGNPIPYEHLARSATRFANQPSRRGRGRHSPGSRPNWTWGRTRTNAPMSKTPQQRAHAGQLTSCIRYFASAVNMCLQERCRGRIAQPDHDRMHGLPSMPRAHWWTMRASVDRFEDLLTFVSLDGLRTIVHPGARRSGHIAICRRASCWSLSALRDPMNTA
jgi:hypothetical protein